MSARRGRAPRHLPIPHDPARDLWWRAVELRTEWCDHALRAEPADRQAAERAIIGLYALLDRPAPAFVWVDSPAAAVRRVPPPAALTSAGSWPVEGRLATAVSTLRAELDRRIGAEVPGHAAVDPVAALGAGAGLRSVLAAGVRDPLRRTVRDAVAGVLRATLPERLGLVWYGQHEADWIAHYDVHRRVAGVRFGAEDAAHLELWAALARSCGWWWPREGVCVIAERPVALVAEPAPGSALGEARPHSAAGPAVAFPDGWAVHAWHGTARIGNRNRTSTRAGAPLKAEAIRCEATTMVECGIRTIADLNAAADDADRLETVRQAWQAVVGQSSGITWRYLLMLAGRPGVKPDRMIKRFVANAVDIEEVSMTTSFAVDAVLGAAGKLAISPTDLDHGI